MKKGLKITCVVIIIVIVLAIGLRLMGYRALRYPKGKNSMSPTISGGDICLCSMKRKYSVEDLQQGMILLFEHRRFSYFLTKRIIAKEGDLVKIQGKRTIVNGHVLNEPYIQHHYPADKAGDVNSVLVPSNKLFVMGDNRESSLDSRYSRFGLIDVKQVKGKPLMIIWSNNKRKIGKRLNWPERIPEHNI